MGTTTFPCEACFRRASNRDCTASMSAAAIGMPLIIVTSSGRGPYRSIQSSRTDSARPPSRHRSAQRLAVSSTSSRLGNERLAFSRAAAASARFSSSIFSCTSASRPRGSSSAASCLTLANPSRAFATSFPAVLLPAYRIQAVASSGLSTTHLSSTASAAAGCLSLSRNSPSSIRKSSVVDRAAGGGVVGSPALAELSAKRPESRRNPTASARMAAACRGSPLPAHAVASMRSIASRSGGLRSVGSSAAVGEGRALRPIASRSHSRCTRASANRRMAIRHCASPSRSPRSSGFLSTAVSTAGRSPAKRRIAPGADIRWMSRAAYSAVACRVSARLPTYRR